MCTDKFSPIFEAAIENRAFPGAVVVIGDADGVYYRNAFGYRRVFDDASPCFDAEPAVIPPSAEKCDTDTLFDMASLSKVLSTSIIALRFVEEGVITLQDTLPRFFDDVHEDKRDISIFRLMTHTSGIPAHFHLSQTAGAPENAARTILEYPLSRPIGSNVEYSCMGYILLGKILEKLSGKPLDELAREYVFEPLGMTRTGYNPISRGESNIAATEYSGELGKYCFGVVHDENARFLGGVSANAGVFSCADDLVKFASMLSRLLRGDDKNAVISYATFKRAIFDYTPGMNDERGLGFQLKSEGMSAMGDLYSPGSFGHNGFTGTSLYIDRDSGLYTILLTNRVHYTRQSDGLFRFRRVLHNMAVSMKR